MRNRFDQQLHHLDEQLTHMENYVRLQFQR